MPPGIYLIEYSAEDENPYIFKSKVIRGYQISFELIEPRLKMGEGFLGTRRSDRQGDHFA